MYLPQTTSLTIFTAKITKAFIYQFRNNFILIFFHHFTDTKASDQITTNFIPFIPSSTLNLYLPKPTSHLPTLRPKSLNQLLHAQLHTQFSFTIFYRQKPPTKPSSILILFFCLNQHHSPTFMVKIAKTTTNQLSHPTSYSFSFTVFIPFLPLNQHQLPSLRTRRL